jgi:hypothetical protein
VKVKTRGEYQDLEPFEEEHLAEDLGDAPTTFQVDRRALRNFGALFHTPSQHRAPPREVAWADFLHAMTSLGFSAENLNGSSWEFTPPLDVDLNPISFHCPHPGTKLTFQIARKMGRWLRRKYEWDGETFEEK